MHVSTSTASTPCARPRSRESRVTAEATPHHFTSLTNRSAPSTPIQDEPPLRGRRARDAVIAGLADGTIDVIASDHAPHAKEKKMRELDQAPFGVVGLKRRWAW